MKLLSAKGINFQSYPSFDIVLPDGPLCIVGANMSGKTTFARAIMFALAGQFPYPGLGRFTKDLVRPGSNATPGSARKKKDEAGVTVVQVRVSFPKMADDGSGNLVGDEVFIVTRTQGADKGQLTLQDEAGSYTFDGDVAQDIILNKSKIPNVGSMSDRVKLLMRILWFGVGQATPFFAAQGTERKKIVESNNPFTKLAALEEDADKRLKVVKADAEALKSNSLEQVGALRSKQEELARRVERAVGRNTESSDGRRAAEELIEKMASSTASPADIDAQVTKLNRDLAAFDAGVLALKRLAVLKENLAALEADFAATGGLAAAEAQENEAAGIAGYATAIAQATADMNELRLAEQAAAHDLSKSEAAQAELAKRLASLQSMTAEIDANVALALATSAAFGLDPACVGECSGDSVTQAAAALESHLTKAAGIKVASPAALSEALNLKITQLSELNAESEAEKLEAKADELLATVAELRAAITGLAYGEAALQSLARSAASMQDKLAGLGVEMSEIGSVSAACKRADLLATIILEVTAKPYQAATKKSQPLKLPELRTAAATFESVLKRLLKVDGVLVPENVLETVAGHMFRQEEAGEMVQTISRRNAEFEAEQTGRRDVLAGRRGDLRREEAQLATYQRALALASAAAPGTKAICGECGSDLSREHIEQHIRPLTEMVSRLNAECSALAATITAGEGVARTHKTEFAKAEDEKTKTLYLISELAAAATRIKEATSPDGTDQQATAVFEAALGQVQIRSQEAQDALAKITAEMVQASEKNALCESRLRDYLGGGLSSTTATGGPNLVDPAATYEASVRAKAAAMKKGAADLRSRGAAMMASLETAEEAARTYLAAVGFNGHEALFKKELSRQVTEQQAVLKNDEAVIQSCRAKLATTQASSASAKAALAAMVGEEPGSSLEAVKAAASALDAEAKASARAAIAKAQAIRADAAKVASAQAVYEEAAAGIPPSLLLAASAAAAVATQVAQTTGVVSDLATQRKAIEEALAAVAARREAAASMGEIKRLAAEVGQMEALFALYGDRLEEKLDEMNALVVIKGLLSPNGETRTLALANDVAAIVATTNEYLASLDLRHSLAVDLKLEKGDDAQPAIEIIFEVDGSTSGRILPSEAQRNIVGLCMDIALMKLGSREGFLFVDEPEAGLDAVNRGKVTQFLKGISPQTILITNTISSGFENSLTTSDIRASGEPLLTTADFGVAIKTKAKRPTGRDGIKGQEQRDGTGPTGEGTGPTGEGTGPTGEGTGLEDTGTI